MAFKSRWNTPGGIGFLSNWVRLYTNQTASELALEPAIAALGKRYRAQHPMFGVHAVADFALLDDKIIIEVDGKSHNTPAAKEADAARTAKLEKLGWVVARCKNEEAVSDPAGTVRRCLAQAQKRRAELTQTPK